MKAVLVGVGDDALGFGLSGTKRFIAASREEVEQCVARITTTVDEPIIIFSQRAAELIPEKIDHWSKRGNGPMFVVLPEEAPCR